MRSTDTSIEQLTEGARMSAWIVLTLFLQHLMSFSGVHPNVDTAWCDFIVWIVSADVDHAPCSLSVNLSHTLLSSSLPLARIPVYISSKTLPVMDNVFGQIYLQITAGECHSLQLHASHQDRNADLMTHADTAFIIVSRSSYIIIFTTKWNNCQYLWK